MAVCILQNLEKYRVLWTDFSASCRETNRFSVSKIGPEPAKPTISLALLRSYGEPASRRDYHLIDRRQALFHPVVSLD